MPPGELIVIIPVLTFPVVFCEVVDTVKESFPLPLLLLRFNQGEVVFTAQNVFEVIVTIACSPELGANRIESGFTLSVLTRLLCTNTTVLVKLSAVLLKTNDSIIGEPLWLKDLVFKVMLSFPDPFNLLLT